MSDSVALPEPTFLTADPEDGSFHVTWCFGEQGHPDSWRVWFLWQPGEGAFAQKLTHTPTTTEEAHDAEIGSALARWLVTANAKEPAK